MPELDKDRIFNESPAKVLMRAYENLKESYTKMDVLKYRQLYENQPLSFILANSRYIFGEPMKGREFYSDVISHYALPLRAYEIEIDKVEAYLRENEDKMSPAQKEDYIHLLETLKAKHRSLANTIHVHDAIIDNADAMDPIYDALYHYERNNNDDDVNTLIQFFTQTRNSRNLIDAVNIGLRCQSLHPHLYDYIMNCCKENPEAPDDYRLNASTDNIMRRMMMDEEIRDRANHVENMNLRHLILGLAGDENDSDMEDSILVKNTEELPHYSEAVTSVNSLFVDDEYAEIYAEEYAQEKISRLECQKAILEMSLAFTIIDEKYAEDENPYVRNPIIEKVCFESTTIEKIPNVSASQIFFLEELISNIDSEISVLTEKYFKADGGVGKVVGQSTGERPQDYEKSFYDPSRHPSTRDSFEDDEDDDEDYEDMTPEEKEKAKKEKEKKKARDSKYADMDEGELDFGEDDLKNEGTENDDDSDSSKTNSDFDPERDKPQKQPLARRIQNKALDANVQFKKKLANGRRGAQDVRNAGKAVAKIPTSIANSVKKDLEDWDEMDDDRRKEYIKRPGFRKKYFKALQLCITHYVAFLINPILNVVLAICQKFSHDKDIRIKNELIRELKTEIKVTEEKIEDARNQGEEGRDAKYKLMRIKEKLDAELVRVAANSKYI